MADVRLLDRLGATEIYEGVEEIHIPSAYGGFTSFRKDDYKVSDLNAYLAIGTVEVNGRTKNVLVLSGSIGGTNGKTLQVQPARLLGLGIDISTYEKNSIASICTLVVTKKNYNLYKPEFFFDYDELDKKISFMYAPNCRMVWVGDIDDICPISMHRSLTVGATGSSLATLSMADGTTDYVSVWAHPYELENGKYTLFYCAAHFDGTYDREYIDKPLFAHFTNTKIAPKKGLYVCVYYDANGEMEHYTRVAQVYETMVYADVNDFLIGNDGDIDLGA